MGHSKMTSRVKCQFLPTPSPFVTEETIDPIII